MCISWQKILVSPEQKIRDVLQVIDKEALRIALVVDDDNFLLGVVTDGDIRRGLLKDISLHDPVSLVMYSKPSVASIESRPNEILKMMEDRKLLAIPLVNNNNQVVGLETLQRLLKKPRHDTPVLLMAGGFGTRLRPLTNKCPKPLLRVGETPILEIMLNNFIKAGFVDFYISTHYLSHMVEDHFGDGSRWGVNIKYLYEETPLGTAGALSLLPKETSELPVIVMNGDILTNTDFESVLSFHLKNNASATMCVRDYEYQVPFGVVKSDGHKVLDIEEKPVQRFFVNTGIYVIGPELRAQVKLGQAIDMPTLLNVGMKMTDSVMMYPVNEYWLDIGRPDDFEKAQVDVEQVSA